MLSTRKIIFKDPCEYEDENIVIVRRPVAPRPCSRVVREYSVPGHRNYYPSYTIAADMAEKIRSSKKQKRNRVDGSFAVLLDEPTVYLEQLVKEAQNLGLTVSGDGTNPTKGGDVTKAGYGDIVTFGTSTRFDVNWIKRSQYACERSIIPIHAISDWDTVTKALKAFAKEKNTLKRTSFSGTRTLSSHCGCAKKVYELEDCRGIRGRLHDDFVKIGFDFIKVEKPVCYREREEVLVLL
jgi:hypothetical protein